MFKIGHIELFANDTQKSKTFFCDVLGFELVVEQDPFIWVKAGDVEILLRPGKPDQKMDKYQDAASAIVLYTNDVTKTASSLEERGLMFKGTDGSDTCLTFTDPDGHWFQLTNPKH